MLSRGEEGFTLVELLISVAILGVVLAAISGVTFTAVRTTADAEVRLDESNDLMLAASYFGDDVQGAQSVSIGTTPRCGADDSVVVELVGEDFADDDTFATSTTVVSYVVRTVTDHAGTGMQLRRLACTDASPSPAFPLTPVPVARWLSSTPPTVDCGSSPCDAFTEVNLTVQERSGGLTYTLTGRRRTS